MAADSYYLFKSFECLAAMRSPNKHANFNYELLSQGGGYIVAMMNYYGFPSLISYSNTQLMRSRLQARVVHWYCGLLIILKAYITINDFPRALGTCSRQNSKELGCILQPSFPRREVDGEGAPNRGIIISRGSNFPLECVIHTKNTCLRGA